MTVRICLTSGRCYNCQDATVDDVTAAIEKGGIYCCHQGANKTLKICVKTTDIFTWEDPGKSKEEEPEPPRDTDPHFLLRGATSVNINYR